MSSYTDADIDVILDFVKDSKTRSAFLIALDKAADQLHKVGSRKEKQTKTELQRLLWGLAVNLNGRVLLPSTTIKGDNEPVSYFDTLAVSWAAKSQSEAKTRTRSSKEKVAIMLRRNVSFVSKLWSRYDEARGRTPFFPEKAKPSDG